MKEILKKLDLECASKLSKEKINELKIIPLYEEDNFVYVLSYGTKENNKKYLEFLYGKNIVFKEIQKEEFKRLYSCLYPDVKDITLEESIINECIKTNVSDIHFEIFDGAVNVRARIDGYLSLIRKIKISDYNQILSRIKLKGNMDIAEKRRPQDGKVTINTQDGNIDCRISTIPTLNGEKMVIRILYKEKLDYKIENLKLLDSQFKDLKKIINVKNGITIISGPTGSGKTTTLYSILSSIKDKDINITTIEDPIECEISGINQMNVNSKINFDFAEGLKYTLRQDPDVIMVGEIRDEETAKMAIRSAITGHKVYSTIHTKSGREVFFRLEDMKVKSYLIKDSLVGTISQRLIGKLCDSCKEKYKTKLFGVEREIYREKGCRECNFTGIKGRRLVCAIHYIGEDMKGYLKNINNNLEFLSNKQMIDVCKKLLLEGDISINQYNRFIEGEELLKYEDDKEAFI
ncbi:GspE/PulE family protein [Clostridium baratii]|uniref:GspE/PulE family protein n=1 Tax=Clostridium baratii TaxID=1561 RepID=UPI00290E1906|nr:GspE/PulE family protein [Clostridium baratii]MDU4910527.1 GspE/PulE family protein [Clostridium baratii]